VLGRPTCEQRRNRRKLADCAPTGDQENYQDNDAISAQRAVFHDLQGIFFGSSSTQSIRTIRDAIFMKTSSEED